MSRYTLAVSLTIFAVSIAVMFAQPAAAGGGFKDDLYTLSREMKGGNIKLKGTNDEVDVSLHKSFSMSSSHSHVSQSQMERESSDRNKNVYTRAVNGGGLKYSRSVRNGRHEEEQMSVSKSYSASRSSQRYSRSQHDKQDLYTQSKRDQYTRSARNGHDEETSRSMSRSSRNSNNNDNSRSKTQTCRGELPCEMQYLQAAGAICGYDLTDLGGRGIDNSRRQFVCAACSWAISVMCPGNCAAFAAIQDSFAQCNADYANSDDGNYNNNDNSNGKRRSADSAATKDYSAAKNDN